MDKIQFAEKEQKKKGRAEDGSGSSSLWHPNIKNSYTSGACGFRFTREKLHVSLHSYST